MLCCSGKDKPNNNHEEEEVPECKCLSGYLDRFVPAWAGDAYKFVVTTVMQVLEPEAIKRRDASKHLSTEEAIAGAAGSNTGLFLIQLATAIHITIHYTNLDNIVANSKVSDDGKQPSKKARGKVAKCNREELAANYHLWLWALQTSHAKGDLRAKLAQWDQHFVLQQKFAKAPDGGDGGGEGGGANHNPFHTWHSNKEDSTSKS